MIVGGTKIRCKDLAFLLAVFVATVSLAPANCFAQQEWDSVSANSSEIQKPKIALEDEIRNRFDLPFEEGAAEDKRRMDDFAAQITVCVIMFRRFGKPILIRLYVVIAIIFMLRSIVKRLATD
jgi:hypothetical protein